MSSSPEWPSHDALLRAVFGEELDHSPCSLYE